MPLRLARNRMRLRGLGASTPSTSLPAAILAPAQIQAFAAAAGFTGDDLNTAVAIALAESSGNANAYNPETGAGAPSGKGSYGLWQIYLNAHPEDAGLNLFDPATNAAAAYSIYATQGFTAWTTYNSGAYTAYLQSAPSVTPDPSTAALTVDDSGDVVETASVTDSSSTDDSGTWLLYGAAAIAAVFLFSAWQDS
jgi:hypothetical protein